MVKANELRIGNWMSFHGELAIQVKTIGESLVNETVRTDSENRIVSYDGCHVNYLEPIQLTPEILRKCGFEKVSKWDYSLNRLVLHDMLSERDEDMEAYIKAGKENIFLKNIKYLHQLQNLFYSLTGEELQLNQLP